jgi:hypothetical protein
MKAKVILIAMSLIMTLSVKSQTTTITVDCSDASADTTYGRLNVSGNTFSVELLNDSINTAEDSCKIDFKSSNQWLLDSEISNFYSVLTDIEFSTSDNDSIPYSFATGKNRYSFSSKKEKVAFRYLYYKATCGGDVTSKIKAIYNEEK